MLDSRGGDGGAPSGFEQQGAPSGYEQRSAPAPAGGQPATPATNAPTLSDDDGDFDDDIAF